MSDLLREGVHLARFIGFGIARADRKGAMHQMIIRWDILGEEYVTWGIGSLGTLVFMQEAEDFYLARMWKMECKHTTRMDETFVTLINRGPA